MGTCLDNRNVWMHLITLRLVFAPTGPNGICLQTKESIVKKSNYYFQRERQNKPYHKRHHRDKEQTVGNLVGKQRLSFPFRQQLTFLQQQVYEGKEHPIDHSLAYKRAERNLLL